MLYLLIMLHMAGPWLIFLEIDNVTSVFNTTEAIATPAWFIAFNRQDPLTVWKKPCQSFDVQEFRLNCIIGQMYMAISIRKWYSVIAEQVLNWQKFG